MAFPCDAGEDKFISVGCESDVGGEEEGCRGVGDVGDGDRGRVEPSCVCECVSVRVCMSTFIPAF